MDCSREGMFLADDVFPDLLEPTKAKSTSVEEIKKEEGRIQPAITVAVGCPYCGEDLEWRLADHVGASASPVCLKCGKKFHLHRTQDEITVHKAFERAAKKPGETAHEKVVCPKCQNDVVGALGLYKNATAWCRCDKCEYLFPIHRKSDGSVMISNP